MGNANAILPFYKDLSLEDLRSHIGFLLSAITAETHIEIGIPSIKALIPLKKIVLKTKNDRIELKLTRGYLGQNSIAPIRKEIKKLNIEFKEVYTPKTKELSKLITHHDFDSIYAKDEILKVLSMILKKLKVESNSFTIRYSGRFDSSYFIQPRDPVRMSKFYLVGLFIGRTLQFLNPIKK